MLDFLKGRYFSKDGVGYYIEGFNSNSKNLIVVSDKDNYQNQFEYDGNLFEIGIEVNIDYYEDWQEKLFNELVRNGRVDIHILSTESGDSWNLEIFRHKTLINNSEFADNLIITNYVIYCNSEVVGDILSKQDLLYSGCMVDEGEMFNKWIERQIEEVPEFNYTEVYSTFNAIVTSTALITDEELKLLSDLFSELY